MKEEDEHHSEEMSTSQSPDACASFDRRNEFTHNHACMTNCICLMMLIILIHILIKIQTPTVIAGVAPNAPKILFLSKLSTKPYMHDTIMFRPITVTYDSIQNRWGCSCCRTKVNCVYKIKMRS